MAGYWDTWQNRLKRPAYGLYGRMKDRALEVLERRGALEHVHGPNDVSCSDEEAILLCLVRNGDLWLDSFIRHHRELGAKHLFFLDNMSTDSTVERARSHPGVTVWRTGLPFKKLEIALRRWMVRRFGRGRWCLICDVDELFDYPHSESLPLPLFLRYLNRCSFEVVAAQMLDMFSDESFARLESRPDDRLKEKYPYYDLTGIRRRRDIYWIDDEVPHHRRLFCTFGGIRERLFDSRGLLQTKHPLVRASRDVRILPYDGHFSSGRVADVTGVLLHYKFLANLYDYAREAVELGQHSRGSIHYRRFYEVLGERPDLSLHSEAARKLETVTDLVEEGFLTVSPRYEHWVESHGAPRTGGTSTGTRPV